MLRRVELLPHGDDRESEENRVQGCHDPKDPTDYIVLTPDPPTDPLRVLPHLRLESPVREPDARHAQRHRNNEDQGQQLPKGEWAEFGHQCVPRRNGLASGIQRATLPY